MDFLNKALAQLTDLFRSMTPGVRITAGLLLTVVVVSLAYLFRYQVSGQDHLLLGGRAFASRDLDNITQAFGRAGLSDFDVRHNQIFIPRGRESTYIAAMSDGNALPANFDQYFDEAVSANNTFASRQERADKFQVAKQKELAQVIRKIPIVEDAAVQYDEIRVRGLRQRKKFTALVSVWLKGNRELDMERVESIRDLVAAAWAGLESENVTVTDLNVGRTYPGSGSDGMVSATKDPYAVRKKMYETGWEAKIRQALVMIEGRIVTVNVGLVPELDHQESTIDYKPRTVTISSESESEDDTTRAAPRGGRPGTAPNVGTSVQTTTVREGPESTKSRSREKENSLASQKKTTIRRPRLIPKRVTATIGVPSNYYLKVWRERNQTEGQAPQPPDATELRAIEDETIKGIENTVVNLLVVGETQPGDDNYPKVTVTTFESLTHAALPVPSFRENTLAWLGQHWSTLGMMFVGMFSLLMLRSMVRSIPAAPTTSRVEYRPNLSVAAVEDEEEETVTHGSEPLLKTRFSTSGPNLRDELVGVISQDPDAAATILRNWIDDAG